MEVQRTLDPRIKILKKIEKDQEAAEEKADRLGKKRKEFLETLFENPIRKTKITEEVVQLRKKALKHEAVRSLLGKYHIPVENVALVSITGEEKYIGSVWDAPINNQWDHIFGKFGSDWYLRQRYVFGSPKDSVKLIFRNSGNGRYYLCGLYVNFPLKG